MIEAGSNLFENCENPICDLMSARSNLILVSKWEFARVGELGRSVTPLSKD